MGFTQFTNLIQKSSPLTQYALMEKKLSLIWIKEILKNPIIGY
jgi:hypothetical protein